MKCKFGSIVTDAAGKLGGHIFQHTRSGIKMSANVIRNTTPTIKQSQQRSNFAKISSTWRDLTTAEKTSWINAAKKITKSNKLGDRYSMSGYSYFSSCNNNLLSANQKMIRTFIPSDNSSSIKSFSFTFNALIPELLINIEATLSENFIMVLEVSKPFGAGIMAQPSNFNFLKLISSSSLTDENIIEDYVNLFGIVPTNNTKIFMRLRMLNISNGIITAGVTANSITELPYYRDYGVNWTDLDQQYSQKRITSLVYLENGICLAGTYPDGKILRSNDNGLTWTDLGQQFSETNILCFTYCSNGIVLAGTGANGHIIRSTDYGLNWTDLGQQSSQSYIYSLSYLENGICLAGTSSGGKILRSTNYGLTWSDLGQQNLQVTIECFTYCGNGICLAGTNPDSNILYSANYGLTWTDRSIDNSQYSIKAIQYLENNTCIAFSYDNGRIYRSTNNGYDWKYLHLFYDDSANAGMVYLFNGIVIAIITDHDGILKSTDYGRTWIPVVTNIDMQYPNSITHCGDGILLTGSYSGGRIYRSVPAYY